VNFRVKKAVLTIPLFLLPARIFQVEFMTLPFNKTSAEQKPAVPCNKSSAELSRLPGAAA
jgi:hypothetical protein